MHLHQLLDHSADLVLTPTTLSLSLLGHLIYGASIGILLPIVCREGVQRAVRWERKPVPLLQQVLAEPIEEEKMGKLLQILLQLAGKPKGKRSDIHFPIFESLRACLIVVI